MPPTHWFSPEPPSQKAATVFLETRLPYLKAVNERQPPWHDYTQSFWPENTDQVLNYLPTAHSGRLAPTVVDFFKQLCYCDYFALFAKRLAENEASLLLQNLLLWMCDIEPMHQVLSRALQTVDAQTAANLIAGNARRRALRSDKFESVLRPLLEKAAGVRAQTKSRQPIDYHFQFDNDTLPHDNRAILFFCRHHEMWIDGSYPYGVEFCNVVDYQGYLQPRANPLLKLWWELILADCRKPSGHDHDYELVCALQHHLVDMSPLSAEFIKEFGVLWQSVTNLFTEAQKWKNVLPDDHLNFTAIRQATDMLRPDNSQYVRSLFSFAEWDRMVKYNMSLAQIFLKNVVCVIIQLEQDFWRYYIERVLVLLQWGMPIYLVEQLLGEPCALAVQTTSLNTASKRIKLINSLAASMRRVCNARSQLSGSRLLAKE